MSLLIVVSTILLAIGIGLSVYAALVLTKEFRKKSWPIAPGTIVTSTFEEKISTRRYSGRFFFPKIHYRYRVNLVDYESEFDTTKIPYFKLQKKDFAESLIEKYKEGSPAEVYYDPLDPSRSALEIKISFSGFIFLMLLSIFVMSCGVIFLTVYLV